MGTNQLILIAGLGAALAIVVVGRNTPTHLDPEIRQPEYIEYASVLWKAQVYDSEIVFVVGDRVIYTARFGSAERHVDSISYRNVNGYFDPVFVTVWKQAQSHRALIIDPVREQTLLQVDSESEIDVSISTNNKIVITYTDPGRRSDSPITDNVVAWPN